MKPLLEEALIRQFMSETTMLPLIVSISSALMPGGSVTSMSTDALTLLRL